MSEILSINPSWPEPERIVRAAELLRGGEVIAIPTDTFYGLAANPFDVTAVEKVFAIKGRPTGNPLLLLIDWVELAAKLADLPPRLTLIGQVVGIHIDERFIKNGLLDTAAMKPIARCGYHDYSVLDETFTMVRPRWRRSRACTPSSTRMKHLVRLICPSPKSPSAALMPSLP